MYKKVVAFLFCLAGTVVNAETFRINRTLVCEKAEIVLKVLLQDFGERPVWQGKNSQGLYTLLTANTRSESWSILITDGDQACVLDSGTGYINPNKPDTRPQVEKGKESGKLTDL